MLIIGKLAPRNSDFIQEDVKAVDMTPWKQGKLVGGILCVTVIIIYAAFADFSVLNDEVVPSDVPAIEVVTGESMDIAIPKDNTITVPADK